MKKIIALIAMALILVGCGGSSSSGTTPSNNSNSYAYVTDGSNFKVIKVNDPQNPVVLDAITNFVEAYGIALANVNSTPVAYVADLAPSGKYVNIIDLSDRSNLTVAGVSKNSVLGKARDLYIDGTTGYIADEYHGLHVIDLTQNIFAPSINYGGDATSVTKFGNYLYLIHMGTPGGFGLEKLDISNPANVVTTGVYNTADVDSGMQGVYAPRLEAGDSYVYVANIASKNLVKFDPNTLAKIAEVDLNGYTTALAISNGYAFVTMHPSSIPPYDSGDDAIKVIKLSNMSITDTKSLTDASGVAVDGNKVYVTDSTGLHIYSFNNGTLTLINNFVGGAGTSIALHVQ